MQLKHNSRTVDVELFPLPSCVRHMSMYVSLGVASGRSRLPNWGFLAEAWIGGWEHLGPTLLAFRILSGDSSNLAGLSNFGSIDQHLRTWMTHQLSRKTDISEALRVLITNLEKKSIFIQSLLEGAYQQLSYRILVVFSRLLKYINLP